MYWPLRLFFPSVIFGNISPGWNLLDCDGDGVLNGDELIDNTDAMKVELGIITSRKELICATI